jgi:hypothetical protein
MFRGEYWQFLTDDAGQSVGNIIRVQESKKEILFNSEDEDQQIVPKRRKEITTIRCVMTQKRAVLGCLAAEA